MHALFKLTIMLFAIFSAGMAQAALTLDRTRAIFDAEEKSISMNISNDNKKLPFLAQSWIEDSNHKKVTSPLVVLPPLQRINMGERSLVRIAQSAGVSALPEDRESLFYFNLREIPPRPEQANVMQIAMQTQIKLFWRPAAIRAERGAVWQDKIIFKKTDQGFSIENPTPYYVTLSNMSNKFKKDSGVEIKGFNPVMIAPKSSENLTLPTTGLNSFVVSYINDYGGHPEVKFVCDSSQICRADSK
ncbi:fimbrial biogenesis chaperone [Winslowiella iniecta]|uniref:Molecular chaperone n=1 Tax=Winslowiella iniecta TaxID=1560201 RepID=A0A0L7SZF8_9GAMM|nr:fimbria/pilus periplasmic chaperone [Winslowiella iniecta]KOC88564.1 hypothetical protein NG42_16050 [Winslowiella iniecta]KOC90556.1 hypothetical protein NG43_16940 [Winslowiella iniecta]